VGTGLARLALAPLPVLFGPGDLPVQPIHVDDVVTALLTLAAGDADGTTVELGGPEVLSMRDLLLRIRAAHGRAFRSPLRLPLGPWRTALAAVEPFLFPLLPLTAGQLASFANRGTARPHPVVDALRPRMRGIDAMIAPARDDG